jgi:hypothetical protein
MLDSVSTPFGFVFTLSGLCNISNRESNDESSMWSSFGAVKDDEYFVGDGVFAFDLEESSSLLV